MLTLPDYIQRLKEQATELASQGHLIESGRLLEKAISLWPNSAALHNNYGQVLFIQGHYDQALTAFRISLELDHGLVPAIISSARILLEQKRIGEALLLIDKSMSLCTADSHLVALQVSALRDGGALHVGLDVGLAHYKESPTEDLCKEILQCYIGLSRYEDAIHLGLSFLEEHGFSSEIMLAIAVSYYLKRDYNNAKACYLQILEVLPEHIRSIEGLGELLGEQGLLQEADSLVRRGLLICPSDARCLQLMFKIQMALGNFEEAWKYSNSRWALKDIVSPTDTVALPLWNPKEQGAIVYVHKEQGIGDLVFVYRIVALYGKTSECTCHFVIECDSRLQEILSDDSCITLIKQGENESALRKCTHQICLMDLPRLILPVLWDEQRECIPKDGIRTEYILTQLSLETRYRIVSRYDLKVKYDKSMEAYRNKGALIGFSWRSKSNILGSSKSIPLEAILTVLSELSSKDNRHYLSLQYLPTSDEQMQFLAQPALDAYLPMNVDFFHDIDSLAFFISQCSAVVTVSNITAHISGLLGIPTYLLLSPYDGTLWQWRYKVGEKSLLYPSVSIITKESPAADWTPYIRTAFRLASSKCNLE